MKLRVLTVLVVAALTSINAASIDHDAVQPFPQPEPATDAERAAVKFKPSLVVERGCHPYPAVNAAGDTSAGLKGSGRLAGECEGSELGSQVYSRSMLYSGKWAIMYAWYFPKDVTEILLPIFRTGTRHRWLSAVVWIDDPALESPTVLALSTQSSNTGSYDKNIPVQRSYLDGSTTKVMYRENQGAGYHVIVPTTESGEFQDLIQWEQMTDEARQALETTDFGENNNVPFNDAFFETYLKYASTYYGYRRRYGSYSYSMWDNSQSGEGGNTSLSV